MPAPNVKSRKTVRGCLLPAVVVLFGLPLLLVGLVALVWYGREASARRQLNERIAALQAQGHPVDDASVQTYYEQQTNAADTDKWLAAIQEVTSDEFRKSSEGVPVLSANGPERVPLPGQPWESEQATRDFVRKWRQLNSQISSLALKAEPVRFPIEFESFDTLLPQTQAMRQVARLIYLNGQLALRDGNSIQLQRSTAALLGAAQVNAGEPFLVSQLVSIAIDGMSLELLKDAIRFDALDTDELESLLVLLQPGTKIGDRWKLSLTGERAMGLPIFLGTVPTQTRIPGRSRDALYYIEMLERASKVKTESLDEFRAGTQAVEAEIQALADASWLAKLDSVLTMSLVPAINAAGDAFVRKAVQHRLATIAVGLRLYQDQHGKLPSELSDLTTVGVDPQQLLPPGGQPFGYRASPDSAILWGFNFRTQHSVPSQPPSTDPSDPAAEENAIWIWELE